MVRKYYTKKTRKQKNATGFHPGKKPIKSRRKTKRIVTKADREKRTKRLKNRRPRVKPNYKNPFPCRRHIQNHSQISQGESAPAYASMYDGDQLNRKTFIIHAHGEFFMDFLETELHIKYQVMLI